MFTLSVNKFPVTVTFSYVGFETKTIVIDKSEAIDVYLVDELYYENVVVVGSRFRPRTSITSPVPIDKY